MRETMLSYVIRMHGHGYISTCYRVPYCIYEWVSIYKSIDTLTTICTVLERLTWAKVTCSHMCLCVSEEKLSLRPPQMLSLFSSDVHANVWAINSSFFALTSSLPLRFSPCHHCVYSRSLALHMTTSQLISSMHNRVYSHGALTFRSWSSIICVTRVFNNIYNSYRYM